MNELERRQMEEKAAAIQHPKGKLTARERLALLFDEGSFCETDAYVTHRCTQFGMEKRTAPGDGVITGYGSVDGRTVYAFAQDFSVMGGSLGEYHCEKIAKLQETALQSGKPLIGLYDSSGARIQEGVSSLAALGKVFERNVRASGIIPQISAIMGPCAGGASYSPALSDFIFMVDQSSYMFITGPDVIKTVTGEEICFDALGGLDVHTTRSGVAHFSAQSDEDCIDQMKQLLTYLPDNCEQAPPRAATGDDPARLCPQLDALLPENPNRTYDMYEIIRAVADADSLLDVQQDFARNMITCLIRLDGQSVGVIANQPLMLAGCIDADAADKAARFIRFCDAFGIPLLTLVDTPGFLPGSQQEHAGIIRHGAKVIYAYSEAAVPKLTLVVRKAYGGAYIGMCSVGLGADLVLAWPTAELAVMGAEGAVNIIFRKDIAAAADPQARRQQLVSEYAQAMSGPEAAAQRGYVSDIIAPAQTRQRIISALAALSGKKRNAAPGKRHGNMPV